MCRAVTLQRYFYNIGFISYYFFLFIECNMNWRCMYSFEANGEVFFTDFESNHTTGKEDNTVYVDLHFLMHFYYVETRRCVLY